MDMNVQHLPVVNLDIISMDESITSARHAYNLLQKNRLMSDNESITATKEKIEVLCNAKLGGVIPSLFMSALDYPSPVEKAVYNMVLCQYAKSKLMSICKDPQELQDLESKLDKIHQDFSQAYKNYLQVKDYPTVIKTMGIGVSSKGGEYDRFRTVSQTSNNNSITVFNDDLSKAYKELESASLTAKEIYNELKTKMDFNEIRLTNEAVKDFAEEVSKIARPVAITIKEENSRKIFSKWIRYAFSFKGEWANEETILALSKLTD